MIGIDLFAGSGGLSQGARDAGIEVCLAVESDSNAAATYTHNHPETPIFISDIRDLKSIDIGSNGQTRILFGGPPCQGFSTANQRTRNSDNPVNWLFLEFLRITKLWMPDWVLFENVTGIAQTEGGVFLTYVLSGLQRLDYTTSVWNLNAADYGVPQVRSRLFVIGSSHNIHLQPPEVSAFRHTTVWEAIFDLPELPNGAATNWMPYRYEAHSGYARLMRDGMQSSSNHIVSKNGSLVTERYQYIPQGGNWEDIPHELMRNYSNRARCHTRIYHRLRYDVPAVVIGNYRKNMLIHPTQNRGLSVREAARLQSFPDRYEFLGSIGFQQQQVGNAVPPLLGKAVFSTIMKYSYEDTSYIKELASM